jgi:hypothetical protein
MLLGHRKNKKGSLIYDMALAAIKNKKWWGGVGLSQKDKWLSPLYIILSYPIHVLLLLAGWLAGCLYSLPFLIFFSSSSVCRPYKNRHYHHHHIATDTSSFTINKWHIIHPQGALTCRTNETRKMI